MTKVKTVYVCQECGMTSPKWMGKCGACGEWNTYVEEEIDDKKKKKPYEWESKRDGTQKVKPQLIAEIRDSDLDRWSAVDEEFNRVLGGGIVPGSLVLIGGEPGIGKSTLLLQVAMQLPERKILYVSGEESEQQIKMRAQRLDHEIQRNCYILTETNTQQIFEHTKRLQPHILIVDSIQTLYSSYLESTPGSVGQIRECAGELQRYAKETRTPVFLIGHINKEGAIAGPKILEHIVDTVLQFEGDRNYNYRILRTIKNRFGSTSELGIYEMLSEGLREVSNPSEILISQREENLSGIAIGAMIEGMRPMLIEVQALVTSAVYGTPQRSATGFDLRRMNMLLAVLEKRCGFALGMQDVFLNMAGGLKVDDPALDLAVVSAMISSFQDNVLPPQIAFAGEVGLSGEIRPVNKIERRIAEAGKLGFKRIYLSKQHTRNLASKKWNIDIRPVTKVEEMMQDIF